jgi:hypothetical protein
MVVLGFISVLIVPVVPMVAVPMAPIRITVTVPIMAMVPIMALSEFDPWAVGADLDLLRPSGRGHR